MDNRVFNVNGTGLGMLRKTIELAFEQESTEVAKAWEFKPDKGLILLWTIGDGIRGTPFPSPIDAQDSAKMAWEWLKSKEAESMTGTGWDANADHDGDNGAGWRVYVEDWGHVGDQTYAICAIRPAVMWYGK